MKTFEIITQNVAIGWKKTDDIGEPDIERIKYEDLRSLILDMFDNEEDHVQKITKAVEAGESFSTTEHGEFREDSEPCDSYLTYGCEVEIKEIPKEQIEKEEQEKLDKLNKIKQTSNEAWVNWLDLMTEKHSFTFTEPIIQELQKFKFPKQFN